MLNKLLIKAKKNKIAILILAVLLLISGLAHGYNMFHFPYYENDEGVYMSQAWSFLTEGKLAPYTYWYDHAPAGWMLIALWLKLTGGPFTFGASVNSGRILMLLLHLGSVSLLFYIARKLSKGHLAGIIAILLFSLSPLGIFFQRRVLLDNIMIFWVFVSLAILLKDKLKLSQIIASATMLGIAILTKENAIFFIPAFLYVIYTKADSHHKSFAIIKWLAISGSIVSVYFLYAFLKGEFFPVGFLGDNTPRVSLLSTLHEQGTRGTKYPFWDTRGDIYIKLVEWISKDAYIMLAGIASTLMGILLSLWQKKIRISTIFIFFLALFLMRGSLVLDFYIVPMLPLLALETGIIISLIVNKISGSSKFKYYLLAGTTISMALLLPLSLSKAQYLKDETSPQLKAIQWTKNNLDENTFIAIDNYSYLDLHQSNHFGEKIFTNADWFQKLNLDPEIRYDKYNNDWKNIEYIVLSHEMVKQINLVPEDLVFVKNALDNSYPIIEWNDNSTSYTDIDKYISTNGDWMAVYKIKDQNKMNLSNSWEYYKKTFLVSYGQAQDISSGDTTSEGQSYTMLRAVLENDRATFDIAWSWTKDHLQYRETDKLFSWLWAKNDNNKYAVIDSATASDADQDIALALLFAHKRWNNEKYLKEAMIVINDIWKMEVVSINNQYYLTSGTGAKRDDSFLINPSYLSPAHYRIFAEVDNQHDWSKLANDSYIFLNKLGNNNDTYLPPNWILIDSNTGDISSATKYISNSDANYYGYDSFRVMWRVALDAKWFESAEANKYLHKSSPFFEKEWKSKGKYSAIYNLDGDPKSNFSSISTSVGALSSLSITNYDDADSIYTNVFEKQFNSQEGYWGDKYNYYDQNWAWLATALYTDNIPNLWENDLR